MKHYPNILVHFHQIHQVQSQLKQLTGAEKFPICDSRIYQWGPSSNNSNSNATEPTAMTSTHPHDIIENRSGNQYLINYIQKYLNVIPKWCFKAILEATQIHKRDLPQLYSIKEIYLILFKATCHVRVKN